jgi:hypothetical protein
VLATAVYGSPKCCLYTYRREERKKKFLFFFLLLVKFQRGEKKSGSKSISIYPSPSTTI